MKFVLILLTLLVCLNVQAQDAVIAVGEAGVEKDKLVVDDAELKHLVGESKTLANDLNEMVKGDFIFYKHKFNNIDYSGKGQNSYSKPQLEAWKESGITYFISSEMGVMANGIEAKYRVWNVTLGKEIFNQRFSVDRKGLRGMGHQIADAIYRSITGKSSIFNSKIVFVSDRTTVRAKDIEKELYIMDFDGRRVEKLTNFRSVVISPSISPDNSKIIFSLIASHKQVTRGKVKTLKNIDLKMFDLKTLKISTVSDRPGINSGAIFGADGNHIYLTLSHTGNTEIFEMNLATHQMRPLTKNGSDDVDPSLTRDGSLMAFLSNRAGRANIYTMDPTGTEKNVKRISWIGQFNATPRFSPDGKEIVFTSWVDGLFDIYRIDAAGANDAYRLTKNFGSNEEPVYSPDGEFIVFTSKRVINRSKAVQDIYIMNRDGEILGQLTNDFGRCFSPQWTNLSK